MPYPLDSFLSALATIYGWTIAFVLVLAAGVYLGIALGAAALPSWNAYGLALGALPFAFILEPVFLLLYAVLIALYLLPLKIDAMPARLLCLSLAGVVVVAVYAIMANRYAAG